MVKNSDLVKLDPFFLSQEQTPKTYKLYLKFPIEVKEGWINILNDRPIGEGIVSDVDEWLLPALCEKASDFFVSDGLAELDDTKLCGLRAKKGDLLNDHLGIEKQMKIAVKSADYQVQLLEKYGKIDTFTGGDYTTKKIPLSYAEKIKGLLLEGTQMVRSAFEVTEVEKNEEQDKTCTVRLALFLQIDKDKV